MFIISSLIYIIKCKNKIIESKILLFGCSFKLLRIPFFFIFIHQNIFGYLFTEETLHKL